MFVYKHIIYIENHYKICVEKRYIYNVDDTLVEIFVYKIHTDIVNEIDFI